MLGDAFGAGIVYHYTKAQFAQADAEHARLAAEQNDKEARLYSQKALSQFFVPF